MTTPMQATQAQGGGGSSAQGLADVIDTILDKGLVIDVFVRVALVGIELLTIDARIVVASVDTYLRFAEATNRLDLNSSKPAGLPQIVNDMQESGAQSKTKGAATGALEAAGDKLREFTGSGDQEREPERRGSSRGGGR
jgi:hypothetical protein